MPVELNANFILQVQKGIEQLVVERATKIAIQAHNRLSIETPVDTGQAQAGWNFTLNTPSFKTPEKSLIKKAKKSGTPIPPQPSVPDQAAKKIGDKYFLTNAVEHIIYLNEGHSEQAGSNFIEKEIEAARKDVEG